MPLTTVYVKYAFNPIPGASASGRFASTPIRMEPNAAHTHVAMVTAPSDMPVLRQDLPGLTKMMYAIVTNVVTSGKNLGAPGGLWCASNWKKRSRARRMIGCVQNEPEPGESDHGF